MKNKLEYLYAFATASLTLRVIEYLHHKFSVESNHVSAIYVIDYWVVKINLKPSVSLHLADNLQAFLNELGICYNPSARIATALAELEAGESSTTVMNRYQVFVVAHGKPEKEEIEIFRNTIVERLGYCPQNMA